MALKAAVMRKINIFASAADIEALTIALARFESFQIDEAEETDGDRSQAVSRPAVAYWQELNTRLGRQKQRIDKLIAILELSLPALEAPPRVVPEEDLKTAEAVLAEAEGPIFLWQRKVSETKAEIQHYRYLLREIQLFSALEVPLADIRQSPFLSWRAGTMPRENLGALQVVLFRRQRLARFFPAYRVRKINIFVPEADIESVALALARFKDFKPIDASDRKEGGALTIWQERAARYAEAKQKLEGIFKTLHMKAPFRALPEKLAPAHDEEEITRDLKDVTSVIDDWQDRKTAQENEITSLEQWLKIVNLLMPFDLPLERLTETTYLHWVAGTVATDNLASLKAILFRIPVIIIPLAAPLAKAASPARVFVLAVTTRPYRTILDRVLHGIFFEPTPLPAFINGRPAHLLPELHRRLTEARQKLRELQREEKSIFQKYYTQLLTLWQRVAGNLEIILTINRFVKHEDLFLISGWLPEPALDKLQILLTGATSGHAALDLAVPGSRGRRGAESILHRPERSSLLEMVFFQVPFVVIPVAEENDRLLLVAVTTHEYAEILDRVLQGVFWESVSLPADISDLPANALVEIQNRLQETEKKLAGLAEEKEQLINAWQQQLFSALRQVYCDLQVAGAIIQLPEQKEQLLISGWVPLFAMDKFLDVIGSTAGQKIDVEVVKPEPGDHRHPPTLLRNPRLLRPFETLINIFGFPSYYEIDPTLITAFSYVFMFGMMFGDIGQGLLLFIAGLIVNRYSIRRKRGGAVQALGAIIAAAGLSSVLFGFVYGSVFGREDIIPALWTHPLRNIPDILAVSIVAGVIFLVSGFVFNIINMYRIRNWPEFFFGRRGLTGLGLYLTLVGGGYLTLQKVLPAWLFVTLLVVFFVLLFLQEPLSRLLKKERPLLETSVGMYSLQAFVDVFETIISFVSNSLSFVRLGAFAIAHVSFTLVIFSLAGRSGLVGQLVIFIIGTIVIVGFEGLVVGIQALRLQYYEFFEKFFQGQGYGFKPFKLFDAKKLAQK